MALQVLGHLAAEVAKWLGPLVIGNMVEAAGTVQDEPATPSSPITISIQVFVGVHSPQGHSADSSRLAV